MLFPKDYSLEEKTRSLQQRMETFCKPENAYLNHIDTAIREENLQMNLSLVLSYIILNLQFPSWSRDEFESIITQYNEKHESNLILADFESRSWIRIIAGRAIIPQVVHSMIRRIGRKEQNGSETDIAADQIHLVGCLKMYSDKFEEDKHPWISLEVLEMLLEDNKLSVTIDFLTAKAILSRDGDTGNYILNGGEYIRHLRNEIAATLWVLCSSKEPTINGFRHFSEILYKVQIWPDKLHQFLPVSALQKIVELASATLLQEGDLLVSDLELSKVWLDTPLYLHHGVSQAVPSVQFDYSGAFAYIENAESHERHLQGIFDHEGSRGYYSSLVKLMMQTDRSGTNPYHQVLKLLKDTSRPFLIRTIYGEIKRTHPGIIPFLLNDSELVPLAFRLIREVVINGNHVQKQVSGGNTLPEVETIRTSFWMEMLAITLDNASNLAIIQEGVNGEMIGRILLLASGDAFHYQSPHPEGLQLHYIKRKRYAETLKRLSECQQTQFNHYPPPPVRPRFLFGLMEDLVEFLVNKFENRPKPTVEFLHLETPLLDLMIEIIRMASKRTAADELTAVQRDQVRSSVNRLIQTSHLLVTKYYTVEKLVVHHYDLVEEMRTVRRGVNEFGFEIIDWGYLFLQWEKAGRLESAIWEVEQSLKFDRAGDHYTEQNRTQLEKIQLFLGSLMLAYISIRKKRAGLEIEGLPINATIEKLDKYIFPLSLRFSVNRVADDGIDVFDEKFRVGINPYYQSLIGLLFKCVNEKDSAFQVSFIDDYFAGSKDLLRMLSAINLLDLKGSKDAISSLIRAIPVESYIATVSTTTELKGAMIEAVNSEEYWAIADPFLEVIQAHLARVHLLNHQEALLLFEVKLLIAYKKKDKAALLAVPVANVEPNNPAQSRSFDELRRYYIALFEIYHEKNYVSGSASLRSLLSGSPKNIRYAYHLYRSSTLSAVAGQNLHELGAARQEWEGFTKRLGDDQNEEMLGLSDAINATAIYFYSAVKDSVSFDQSLNLLSHGHLYDPELIPTVYKYYQERGMDDTAYSYLQDAKEYLERTTDEIPSRVIQLISGSETDNLLVRYRVTLDRIRSLKASNIPRIIPDTINEQRELSLFIFNEIIQASRIMQEKRASLQQVTQENRFNDFLQSLLRMRFPFFGWSIPDQARLSISNAGADAGNADLVVQTGGGKNIALIEAFILRDKVYTQAHLLKCPNYVGTTDRFYSVVYDLEDPADTEKHWAKYQEHVLQTPFPASFEMDENVGFEDLHDSFEDVNHFKIARTKHVNHQSLYHLMINLRS